MKAVVIERAEILVPNPAHKSLSGTNKFIEKGSELEGNISVIAGQRKGKPFDYRTFKTDKNQYIYLNKVKLNDMNSNADAQVKTTVIDTHARGILHYAQWAGAIGGGFLFYKVAKKKGKAGRTLLIWTGVGALAGYGAGRLLQKQQGILVKKK